MLMDIYPLFLINNVYDVIKLITRLYKKGASANI